MDVVREVSFIRFTVAPFKCRFLLISSLLYITYSLHLYRVAECFLKKVICHLIFSAGTLMVDKHLIC